MQNSHEHLSHETGPQRIKQSRLLRAIVHGEALPHIKAQLGRTLVEWGTRLSADPQAGEHTIDTPDTPLVDIVYSEVLTRSDVNVAHAESALENMSGKALPELLTRLEKPHNGVMTPEDRYYSNINQFAGRWYQMAKNINPEKGTLIRWKNKRSSFLPEEAAVGILIDMGIIPEDANDLGKQILANSVTVRKDDESKQLVEGSEHFGTQRYELLVASRNNVDGYMLNAFKYVFPL